MKRKNAEKTPLAQLLGALPDYPADALLDDGAVHILGAHGLYLENCRGILSLSDTQLVFRMRRCLVTVCGERLAVDSFSGRGVGVSGEVCSVSLAREAADE